MSWISFVAKRFFKSRKNDKFLNLTSKIAVISASIGIAVLIITMSVIRGFEKSVFEKVLKDQGHVMFFGNGPFKPDELLKEVPPCLKCHPLIETYGIISFGSRIESCLIRGLPHSEWSKISKKDSGAIIGKKLASYLHIQKEDSINIIAPVFAKDPIGVVPESLDFDVIGTEQFGMHELNRSGVFIPIKEGQEKLEMEDKVHKVICFYDGNINKIDSIMPDLRGKFKNYDVFSWKDLNLFFADIMRIQRNMVIVILSSVILLASVATFCSVILFVNMKKREVGILKVLGATNRNIISIFLRIGIKISFLSVFFGTFFGTLISYYLDFIRQFFEKLFRVPMFDPQVYLLPAIPVNIIYTDILFISLGSFLLVFMASVWPAFKSTKSSKVNNF